MTDDLDVRQAIAHGALIGRVEKIDPEAAQWMRDNPIHVLRTGELYCAFSWANTPQGDSYWRSIARKLGEVP